MTNWESFVNSYLNFHYGLGCTIAAIIFCAYLFVLYQKRNSQGRSMSKKEILCGLAFSVYVTVVLGGTLLNREIGEEYLIEPIPFWSYYEVAITKEGPLFWQMVYNVIVFVPWGILVPELCKKMRKFKWAIGSVALFSLSIELVQLVFKLGLFEFDDVFHNVLGSVIGYCVWRAWGREESLTFYKKMSKRVEKIKKV